MKGKGRIKPQTEKQIISVYILTVRVGLSVWAFFLDLKVAYPLKSCVGLLKKVKNSTGWSVSRTQHMEGNTLILVEAKQFFTPSKPN